MKLPELRIGNFFIHEGLYEELNKAGRITAITKKHIDLDSKSVHLHQLIPIDITEEILLHSGFKHFDWLKDAPLFECNLFKCTLHDNGVSLFCDGLNVLKPVKYLHQLQNLYYDLTGEELEIDSDYLTKTATEALNLSRELK